MFAYKKIWFGILTLIVIAATFAISRVVTSVFDVGYWYAVGSIMLAELQCGLIVIAWMNSDLRTIPVFGGNFAQMDRHMRFFNKASLIMNQRHSLAVPKTNFYALRSSFV